MQPHSDWAEEMVKVRTPKTNDDGKNIAEGASSMLATRLYDNRASLAKSHEPFCEGNNVDEEGFYQPQSIQSQSMTSLAFQRQSTASEKQLQESELIENRT